MKSRIFLLWCILPCYGIILSYAAMAKLVDALDSGSSRGNPVDVRVILAAISYKKSDSDYVKL